MGSYPGIKERGFAPEKNRENNLVLNGAIAVEGAAVPREFKGKILVVEDLASAKLSSLPENSILVTSGGQELGDIFFLPKMPKALVTNAGVTAHGFSMARESNRIPPNFVAIGRVEDAVEKLKTGDMVQIQLLDGNDAKIIKLTAKTKRT